MDEERKAALKQLLRERYNELTEEADFGHKATMEYVGTKSGEEARSTVELGGPINVGNLYLMASALATQCQAEYLMLVGNLWVPNTETDAFIGLLMCSDGTTMTLISEIKEEGDEYVVGEMKEEERVVAMTDTPRYDVGKAF